MDKVQNHTMNLILHGNWHNSLFFIWGEASEPAPLQSSERSGQDLPQQTEEEALEQEE